MSATEYTEKAKKFAHGLKLVDPTIQLISCGHTVSTGFLATSDCRAQRIGIERCWRQWLDTPICIPFTTSELSWRNQARPTLLIPSSMVNHDKLSGPGFMYEKNVFGPAVSWSFVFTTGDDD